MSGPRRRVVVHTRLDDGDHCQLVCGHMQTEPVRAMHLAAPNWVNCKQCEQVAWGDKP